MEAATLERAESVQKKEEAPPKTIAWLAPFHALDRFVQGLESCLIVVLMAAMLLLGTMQIFMWNFFHQGQAWVDPLLRHLVLWTAMIGGTMATGARRHLCMDVLPRLLPPRLKNAASLLVSLAAAVVVGILSAVTVVFVREEALNGGMAGFLNLARWQVQIILPIAFAVMSARFGLAALEDLSKILSPGEDIR